MKKDSILCFLDFDIYLINICFSIIPLLIYITFLIAARPNMI